MQQKNLIVKKTARYFTLGENTTATNDYLFVLHGYAQLANYFLGNFELLQRPGLLIIAPEGLHRFYQNGFSGRVAASWMTREAREDDIADTVGFLHDLKEHLLQERGSRDIKVEVLGFSQGTAAASRWVANTDIAVERLILWGGGIASDLSEPAIEKLRKTDCVLVAGTNDEFISEEKFQEEKKLIEKLGVSYQAVRYDGSHRIQQETLVKLFSQKSF